MYPAALAAWSALRFFVHQVRAYSLALMVIAMRKGRISFHCPETLGLTGHYPDTTRYNLDGNTIVLQLMICLFMVFDVWKILC
jgi:hypothetical protein